MRDCPLIVNNSDKEILYYIIFCDTVNCLTLTLNNPLFILFFILDKGG